MMIGTATAVRPNNIIGFRKNMLGECRRACLTSGGAKTKCEVTTQNFVQRLSRVNGHVMAIILLAPAAQSEPEGFHLTQITFPNITRPGEDFWNFLEAMKFNEAGEW